MDVALVIHDTPAESVRRAIVAPLSRFNADSGYPPDAQSLALTLSAAAGEVAGGLWGTTIYDWLVVDLLFVPSDLRGRG